jgi:flagellar biosynthesis anti-sigma factor FlgM
MRSTHTDGGRQYSDGLLPSSPQIRADKIAQLRQAVESGNYRVSAEQIAEKMMQEALIAMLA